MAPWPNRSDSYLIPGVLPPPDHPPPPPPVVAPHTGSTTSNSRSSAAAAATTRRATNGSRRATNTSRMTQFVVLNGSQLDVSSSSDDDQHPPSRPAPARPHHGRSMSHPFPSLFSNKKRQPQPAPGESDSDSSDNIPVPLTRNQSRAQPPRTHTRMGPNSGSKDFASGTCMTCGSLVRWPRELQVFRCVICATINDLQPLATDERTELPSAEKAGLDDASTLPTQAHLNSKILVIPGSEASN